MKETNPSNAVNVYKQGLLGIWQQSRISERICLSMPGHMASMTNYQSRFGIQCKDGERARDTRAIRNPYYDFTYTLLLKGVLVSYSTDTLSLTTRENCTKITSSGDHEPS